MIVINLFGVPGSGKSTCAAYVFAKLKMKGINAELITEFAKDKVWENNTEVFKNQPYIFGKQSYRMSRCRDKVDVIVTDSPLPLTLLYNQDTILGCEFDQVVMNVFTSYTNMNFLLKRDFPYSKIGRHENEEQSKNLESPLKTLLSIHKIPYFEIESNSNTYDRIVNLALWRCQELKRGEKTETKL